MSRRTLETLDFDGRYRGLRWYKGNEIIVIIVHSGRRLYIERHRSGKVEGQWLPESWVLV